MHHFGKIDKEVPALAIDHIKCLCIIADVIASRKTDKKSELKHIAMELNNRFQGRMVTDFTVRAGDELFVILRTWRDGYDAIKQLLLLSEAMAVPLYVGVGLGYVRDDNTDNPHEVNGSAIWHASDALAVLKKDKTGTAKPSAIRRSFRLQIQASSELPYDAIHYQICFLFDRILKRTRKQQDVVEAVEAAPDETHYEEIGQRFGYDQYPSINVSKMLARADYALILGAERSLRKLLDYTEQQQLDDVGGNHS